eukprot:gene5348-biopygen12191
MKFAGFLCLVLGGRTQFLPDDPELKSPLAAQYQGERCAFYDVAISIHVWDSFCSDQQASPTSLSATATAHALAAGRIAHGTPTGRTASTQSCKAAHVGRTLAHGPEPVGTAQVQPVEDERRVVGAAAVGELGLRTSAAPPRVEVELRGEERDAQQHRSVDEQAARRGSGGAREARVPPTEIGRVTRACLEKWGRGSGNDAFHSRTSLRSDLPIAGT